MNTRTNLTCKHADCKYARQLSNANFKTCDYIVITGQKRPCKATPDCMSYVKKNKRGKANKE